VVERGGGEVDVLRRDLPEALHQPQGDVVGLAHRALGKR
jgi:hypothetical protein